MKVTKQMEFFKLGKENFKAFEEFLAEQELTLAEVIEELIFSLMSQDTLQKDEIKNYARKWFEACFDINYPDVEHPSVYEYEGNPWNEDYTQILARVLAETERAGRHKKPAPQE